nr:hypothetical protein [Klebsiella variicola]
MTNKKMTPAEKLKASRKRYKKIWLQLDIANAKRFDEKEVLSVDTYRSSYETRKKEGGRQIDYTTLEHNSQIERRSGQGQRRPRCFRRSLQRAPEHAGCRRRSSDYQVGKGVFNFE